MKASIPIETERKFLIKMPDISALEALDGTKKAKIVQTYLKSENDVTRRVRKKTLGGSIKYILTDKTKLSDMSCIEEESEIDEALYSELLKTAIAGTLPIEKTRYAIPYGDFVWEIDVYPFWQDRAIAEIELRSEEQEFEIPPFISVIKEVTSDKRYKNRALAESIPNDKI